MILEDMHPAFVLMALAANTRANDLRETVNVACVVVATPRLFQLVSQTFRPGLGSVDTPAEIDVILQSHLLRLLGEDQGK